MTLTYDKFATILCSYFEVKEIKLRHKTIFKWVSANFKPESLENLLNHIFINCKFFPTIAEIQHFSDLSTEDKAILAANQAVDAILSHKATDELTTEILNAQGGIDDLNWRYQTGDLNLSMAHAQFKKIAQALINEKKIIRNNNLNILNYYPELLKIEGNK